MKRNPTKRSPEGQRAYDEFRRRHCRSNACWMCGEVFYQLQVHHIAKRRGLIYDDLRNFFAACLHCHARIEGNTIVVDGKRLEPIMDEWVLARKKVIDPYNWDLAFLRLLAGPGDGRLNMEFGRGME